MTDEQQQQPAEAFQHHEHTTLVDIIRNLAQRVEALEKKAAQEIVAHVKSPFTAHNKPDSEQG